MAAKDQTLNPSCRYRKKGVLKRRDVPEKNCGGNSNGGGADGGRRSTHLEVEGSSQERRRKKKGRLLGFLFPLKM